LCRYRTAGKARRHECTGERGAAGLWLEDVGRLADMRESYVTRARRRGIPSWRDDGLLVRYAELRPDAPVSAACVGPNGRRRS